MIDLLGRPLLLLLMLLLLLLLLIASLTIAISYSLLDYHSGINQNGLLK